MRCRSPTSRPGRRTTGRSRKARWSSSAPAGRRTWPDPALSTTFPFPGVGLDALKFLHEERHILFHGHEPLDTDATPTLEGEYWLLHNGYTQAEGVANLDEVPETGCLVAIGYAKIAGGLGGIARYVAICPPDCADRGQHLGGGRAAAEDGEAAALGRDRGDAGALRGSARSGWLRIGAGHIVPNPLDCLVATSSGRLDREPTLSDACVACGSSPGARARGRRWGTGGPDAGIGARVPWWTRLRGRPWEGSRAPISPTVELG